MSTQRHKITVLSDYPPHGSPAEPRSPQARNQSHDAILLSGLVDCGYDVASVSFSSKGRFLLDIEASNPDLIFNAACSCLPAEVDVAGALELFGLPVVGTGPVGLALSADKEISKTILRGRGITVPDFLAVPLGCSPMKSVTFPALVKPISLGGSAGIHRRSLVATNSQLKDRVAAVHRTFGVGAIVETYIDGRDLTVGLIGNRNPMVLEPREFRYRANDARYRSIHNKRRRIGSLRAPQLSRRERDSLEKTVTNAFDALQLRDYAAFDLRLAPDGEFYVVDANANPSLNPRSPRWQPIPYVRLLDEIVSAARHRAGAGTEVRS